MSLPRYPEYKDSGVVWLGEVPEHWAVTALKRGFNVTLGKMLQPESGGPDDELLPYLRAANIQWNGVDTTDIKQMWLSKRDRSQLRLERGDLLVSEGGDVGRSCCWEAELDECYFQNSVNRVRAYDGHSNRYLYYWMSTIKDKGYIDVLCNKSTIAHFTAEKVAAVPVPLPPSTEQTQIAIFLDRETGKIDDLIAEQRRLVELLAEKRQAVISHAVTKGLNPNAPMRDSGIEWLGEVPEHWEVKRIRHFANVLRGKFTHRPRNDPGFYDGDFPFIQTGDITGSSRYITEYKQTLNEKGVAVSKEFPKGTLVMAIAANIGDVAILDFPAYFPDSIVGLVPNASTELMFMFYLMIAMKQPMLMNATVSTQMNLNVDKITSLIAACPPIEEQQSIATFLDNETSKFDTLTAEAQRAIALLQERRRALISAAVTGKIDVRNT